LQDSTKSSEIRREDRAEVPASTPSGMTAVEGSEDSAEDYDDDIEEDSDGSPVSENDTAFVEEDADSSVGSKKRRKRRNSSDDKKGGRRKINIEFIENKSRRHVTFSKRKAGLIKKAYELSTLTGTQVLLLVASETGNVYTFATPKLQPLITRPEGKALIQECLNPRDMAELSLAGSTPPRTRMHNISSDISNTSDVGMFPGIEQELILGSAKKERSGHHRSTCNSNGSKTSAKTTDVTASNSSGNSVGFGGQQQHMPATSSGRHSSSNSNGVSHHNSAATIRDTSTAIQQQQAAAAAFASAAAAAAAVYNSQGTSNAPPSNPLAALGVGLGPSVFPSMHTYMQSLPTNMGNRGFSYLSQ